jgi:hypothetical protein
VWWWAWQFWRSRPEMRNLFNQTNTEIPITCHARVASQPAGSIAFTGREREEEDLMLIEGVAVDGGKWLDRYHKPPC